MQSNSARKNAHPALREIINMGQPAVPLILERMQVRGGHWLEALQQMTGATPVPPENRGRIEEMTQAWLEWGELNGYLKLGAATNPSVRKTGQRRP